MSSCQCIFPFVYLSLLNLNKNIITVDIEDIVSLNLGLIVSNVSIIFYHLNCNYRPNHNHIFLFKYLFYKNIKNVIQFYFPTY
jgi:hypothetical protein